MISSATNRTAYAGNAVTTSFAVPFKFMANSDIKAELVNTVTLAVTPLAEGPDYSLSGAGVDAGGTLVMIVAPAAGLNLVIYCDPAVSQPYQQIDTDSFPSAGLNDEFDRTTIIARRALDIAKRAVGLDEGQVNAFNTKLPINPTAQYVIAINDTADGLAVVPSSGVAGPPGPPGAPGSAILTTIDGPDAAHLILPAHQYTRTTSVLTAQRIYTMSPAAAKGEVHYIKNLAFQTFNLVVAAAGGETIDGLASVILPPSVGIILICGAIGQWDVI